MPGIVLAKSSDIPAGTMKPLLADGRKILLANIDGTFHAINLACPHMGADLSKGTLVGCIVTCPKHGAAYDVTNGHAVESFPPMSRKNAVTWRVWIENDEVLTEVC